MGTFSYPIEIGDPGGGRFEKIDALVDTGASYTIGPAEVLARLGVAPYQRRDFRLADGRVVDLDLGQTWARVDGLTVITLVVFGAEGMGPVVGAYTLEGLGLAVDPASRQLFPRPALLMGTAPAT